jgi:hypothetical protein
LILDSLVSVLSVLVFCLEVYIAIKGERIHDNQIGEIQKKISISEINNIIERNNPIVNGNLKIENAFLIEMRLSTLRFWFFQITFFPKNVYIINWTYINILVGAIKEDSIISIRNKKDIVNLDFKILFGLWNSIIKEINFGTNNKDNVITCNCNALPIKNSLNIISNSLELNASLKNLRSSRYKTREIKINNNQRALER